MSEQSLFVYEGMRDAANYYDTKAGEIRELCTAIQSRNTQLISSEWNGDSAKAFSERFEQDHAKKLEAIAGALDDISKTIAQLVASRLEWETEQAGKFKY